AADADRQLQKPLNAAVLQEPTSATESKRPPITSERDADFHLADGDIELIKLVYEYRFVATEHLAKLTGRSYKNVHERLLKLFEQHYLSRQELPPKKHIYFLDSASLPVLVEQVNASNESVNAQLRHPEL